MNLSLAVSQTVLLCFAGLAFWAAWSDVQRLMIPNAICLAILLLYPIHLLSAGHPVDWPWALLGAVIVLCAGFVLFALGWAGGGDAKLLAVGALWAGPALIAPFIVYTALAGGAIAIALWIRHRFSRAASPALVLVTGADPEFHKQPMPYGAAIAIGALYVAQALLRGV